MIFWFKKITAPLLFPVPLSLIAGVLGILGLWLAGGAIWARLLVTFSVLLFGLSCYRPVADALLAPLERRYPAFDPQTAELKPEYVVVLGGGDTYDPTVPRTSQAAETTRVRLIEGIRIVCCFPGSKLLLSGGNVYGFDTGARLMAWIAESLGVDPDDIAVEDESRNTADQARILAPLLKDRCVVLVTSASHMPRSMALFEKQGLNPIPAPAGHRVKARSKTDFLIYPGANELKKTERAIYEYLGLVWGKIRQEL